MAGINNIILEARVENSNTEDIEKANAEDEKESQIEKKKISDYLNTKEEDYLSFPMKYALVSNNADNYLNDIEYLYLSLKHQKIPIKQIIQLFSKNKIFIRQKRCSIAEGTI